MSSKAAILALLSLAGQSFAAPVYGGAAETTATYNNGQWVSTGPWDDGQYTWKPETETAAPTVPASTAVAAPTSVASPSVVSPSGINTVSSVVVEPTSSASPTKSGGVFASVATTAKATSKPAAATTTKEPASATSSASTGNAPKLSGRGPTRSGDGSVAAGWPAESDWLSFEALWGLNVGSINSGCTGGVQNSAAETQDIHDGILAAEKSYSVPAQFILATIMQESHGCVRVGQTANGVTNPGIMQDHNGSHNCVGVAAGACSKDEITGMLTDGVNGTSSGRGLKQEIAAAPALGGASTSQNVYIAARLYNSGDSSYQKGGDLSQAAGATATYSQDISNRMIGYVF